MSSGVAHSSPLAGPSALRFASRLASRGAGAWLRLAAFGVSLLVVTMGLGLHLAGQSPLRYLPGDDFLPSYMAGDFVRRGHPELLTRYDAAQRFQADVRRSAGLEQHGRTGPWLNPPFFAWLFVPLSALPYRSALACWLAINVGLLAASLSLLYRLLPAPHRRVRDGLTLAVLVLFSMPGVQVMACQQNTFLSLFIVCSSVTCVRSQRPFAAGLIAALLLFKPQLALLLCGAVALTMGWRAVAGMAVTATLLVGGSELLIPGGLADYFQHLSALLPYLRTDRPYAWERQMTGLAFWRLWTGGRSGGPNSFAVTALWMAGALAVAGALALGLRRAIVAFFGGRTSRPGATDAESILALTLIAAPLLMPYYMDYDLLLLAVPATLQAARSFRQDQRQDTKGIDRLLVFAWGALYGLLFVNSSIGAASGVNTGVLVLLMLFALSAWRHLQDMRRAETGGTKPTDVSSPAEIDFVLDARGLSEAAA